MPRRRVYTVEEVKDAGRKLEEAFQVLNAAWGKGPGHNRDNPAQEEVLEAASTLKQCGMLYNAID